MAPWRDHLKDAKGWDEKVLRAACRSWKRRRPRSAPRKLVLSSVDAIMAEILSGSAALHELMGRAENLAEALNSLVELFLGKRHRTAITARACAAGRTISPPTNLPEARTAIAGRIMAEFKSAKRLCPEFAGRGTEGAARHRQPRGDGGGQISQPRRSDRGLHLALQAAGDARKALGRLYRRSVRPTRRSSACCSSKKTSSASRTSASWPISCCRC